MYHIDRKHSRPSFRSREKTTLLLEILRFRCDKSVINNSFIVLKSSNEIAIFLSKLHANIF